MVHVSDSAVEGYQAPPAQFGTDGVRVHSFIPCAVPGIDENGVSHGFMWLFLVTLSDNMQVPAWAACGQHAKDRVNAQCELFAKQGHGEVWPVSARMLYYRDTP